MRHLSEFGDVQLAHGLVQALHEKGIEASVRQMDSFEVWVMDDENILQARQVLQAFSRAPVLAPPPKIVKQPSRQREVIADSAGISRQMTTVLILISCCVFLAQQGGVPQAITQKLFIGSYSEPRFADILHGEVWRILTPIFLHQNWLHIGFNMLWLYQLGSLIETLGGPRKLILLVVISGCLSNLLQYVVSGPDFGGMSGVIYALLCYAWGMGTWKAGSQYHVDKATFGFMMVWFVMCFFGIFGSVANFSHLGGLLVGLGWAWLESRPSRRPSM